MALYNQSGGFRLFIHQGHLFYFILFNFFLSCFPSASLSSAARDPPLSSFTASVANPHNGRREQLQRCGQGRVAPRCRRAHHGPDVDHTEPRAVRAALLDSVNAPSGSLPETSWKPNSAVRNSSTALMFFLIYDLDTYLILAGDWVALFLQQHRFLVT